MWTPSFWRSRLIADKGSKIGKILRTSFMDGPLDLRVIAGTMLYSCGNFPQVFCNAS